MDKFTIECTMCGCSFDFENEYNNHQCTDDAENGMAIKQEPQDKEPIDDPELNNIKRELNNESDPDDVERMEVDLDPLTLHPSDMFTIKQEEANEFVRTLADSEVQNNASIFAGEIQSNYNCKLCGAHFDKKEYFQKHFQAEHRSYKPYECHVCKKKFLHKHYVNLHMRVHTGERPYECQLCPKTYSHKTSFTIHMRIHNGDRPYVCSICGKRCYDKSGLTSHMRSHTKETPYQCEVCGRRFTHSKSLLVHRRNHTGEKPYVCSYCGKAFRHWHKHKIHVRLHTGERPYKCKLCGKGFPRNDEVSRHMRSHQGIKSFKCSICGVYCATQASITGHIQLHHFNLQSDNENLPEKTLVKDGQSGILGTKVPEPRSKYLKANNSSTEIDDSIASTSEQNDTATISKPSTRVIEITSKDTPLTISTKQKKSTTNKLSSLLSKGADDDKEDQSQALSQKEFLEWQQRMLTKQGLVVKGYSEKDKATNLDSRAQESNNNSPALTLSNQPTLDEEKNTAIGQSKLQYILLAQGQGENATKILLPLNVASLGSKVAINQVKPSTPSIKSNNSGGVVQNPMYVLRQSGSVPSSTNQQPLIFLANSAGGRKMIFLSGNNRLPNADIKKEPEENNLPTGLTAEPLNVMIKAERPTPPSSPPTLNPMNVVIKQEPTSDN